MNEEVAARLARLDDAVVELHRVYRRAANWELTHRALLLALLDQPDLNYARLLEDFDLYLNQIAEDLAPRQQDRAILMYYRNEIARRKSDASSPPPASE